MAEIDHEEWKELRSRVDSLASAVFLISGGTLTLSVSVLMGINGQVTPSLRDLVSFSWQALFASMVGFVLLKTILILQSYLRGTIPSQRFNRINAALNSAGWTAGVIALALFFVGMYSILGIGLAVIFPT